MCQLGNRDDIMTEISFKKRLIALRYPDLSLCVALALQVPHPGTRHIFSTMTPNRSSLYLRGRMDTSCSTLLGRKSGYDYEVQFRLSKGIAALGI